jgi:hypothetical protein
MPKLIRKKRRPLRSESRRDMESLAIKIAHWEREEPREEGRAKL